MLVMPAISIIIPVYNVERFLERCLDSVLAQTWRDWEAVCVNDGSLDSCQAILERYASADSRIRMVNKPNGGLSDARNVGLKNAAGEFIVYLDSDDFIHPQTLEIAMALQQKTGTDIVSWYKDPNYRNKTFVRHFLGLDTIAYKPFGYRKKYDVEKIKYQVTDDVFAHCTEYSHPKGIDWPVKHFYVWRHLLRKSLIEDIQFIKGLTFEDFPWWSAVMLKSPSMTITYLPFYYYYPNFASIDLGSSRVKKTRNWCRGLDVSYRLYREKATDYQMNKWSQNCKWPVISSMIARWLDKFVPGTPEYEYIWDTLSSLWEEGAFNDAQTDRDINSAEKLRQFLKR